MVPSWKLEAEVNGVLVVDKPAGPTSHDVVARVRRALGMSRVGHTGTLDPLATGVLPLVIGRATRLAAMLTGADKEYDAGVRFGLATDTYDAAGRRGAPPPAPAGLDAARIEEALGGFRGTFSQMPPAYSAKKVGGVAAYTLARRNEAVELQAVSVTVSRLELLAYRDGLARVLVTATAGFYVRSLAHDLGQRLGCGAHLESLRRCRAGMFGLADAVTLEEVEAEGRDAGLRLVSLDRLLPQIPAAVLNERGAQRAAHGHTLEPSDFTGLQGVPRVGEADAEAPRRVRLLDGSGGLLGIAETRPGGLLHPVIVLV